MDVTGQEKISSAMNTLGKVLNDAHMRDETIVLPEHQAGFLNHRRRIADILTTDQGAAGAEIAAGYIYAEAFGMQQQDPELARAAVHRAAGPKAANVACELMMKAQDPEGRVWHGWEPLSTDSKDTLLASWAATLDAKREEILGGTQSGTQSVQDAAGATIAAGEAMRHAAGFGGSDGLKILYEASLDGADQAYQARYGTSPKSDAVGVLTNAGMGRDELPVALTHRTPDDGVQQNLVAAKK